MTPPARTLWLAQVLLLVLFIFPSLGFSPLVVDNIGFPVFAGAVLIRDLALLALVAYFVWSEGASPRSIGWTRGTMPREALLGVALFIPTLLFLALLQLLLQMAGLPPPTPPPDVLVPHGLPEFGIAVVLLIVVAITEETIFRGFLFTRLLALTGRPALAIGLSTVVFAAGHGYQGITGVLAVAALGLLYAVIFLWRGSLTAPCVMHFLQNATGMFLLGSNSGS